MGAQLKWPDFEASLADQIKAFVSLEIRNGWVQGDDIRLYLRTGLRRVDGGIVKALTIASVSVHEEKQGQGVFTAVLTEIEKIAGDAGLSVFVENVQTSRFAGFFRRRGYEQVDVCLPDICFVGRQGARE